MSTVLPKTLLWLPRSTVTSLLQCYDYPHPLKPGKIIKGYDKAHVLRTAKMAAAVAHYLGHDDDRIRRFQIACLLHDMGRAGLDRILFGKIWTWARKQGIPTRPAEWRAQYPDTSYGKETESFWKLYRLPLQDAGIDTSHWAREQVEMRLGYARRQRRMLKRIRPTLLRLDIQWSRWMEKVTLFYYYPEQLKENPAWVRELGEVLVACEQLEAHSNRKRGGDYYNRYSESFADAFTYLDSLYKQGQLSTKVLHIVRGLTAQGLFDGLLSAARKKELSKKDLRFLRSLNRKESTCRL